MTQRLEHKSAYDAASMVLAEELNATLWTLDGHSPATQDHATPGKAHPP